MGKPLKQLMSALRFEPHSEAEQVAGIYITDNHIHAMSGQVYKETIPPRKEYRDYYARYYPIIVQEAGRVSIPADKNNLTRQLQEIAKCMSDALPKVRAVGVGSYGPFGSVDIDDRPEPELNGRPSNVAKPRGKTYGAVLKSDVRTHFGAGDNLYELIASPFHRAGRETEILIRTDVAVSAFAEAVLDQYKNYVGALKVNPDQSWDAIVNDRSWTAATDRHVVACIKASVGVGGAIVAGRDFWPHARSSEMGNIHVAIDKRDLWAVSKADIYSTQIERLISQKALEARLTYMNSSLTLEELYAGCDGDPDAEAIWSSFAFYVAQICVAITTTALPDRIILTGRSLKVKGVIKLVRSRFKKLMQEIPQAVSQFRKDTWNNEGYLAEPMSTNNGLHGATMLAATAL